MCQYIKDNDEQCDMEEEPFCHHHEDSVQATLHDIGVEMFDGGDVPTGGQFAQLIATAVEEHESDVSAAFDPQWTPTSCSECESAVRVVCARLDEAAFQPDKVIATLALTCPCGDSVQYDPSWNGVPKSEIPDNWLDE